MNLDKLSILRTAISELEKRLKKSEKQVKKWSDKLKDLDDKNSTVRKRANLRIKLDDSCEERDRYLKLIRIAEEWREEIKGGK